MIESLIAYNSVDLEAQLIRDKSESWYKKGLLSTESWDKIKAHYTINFYTPNVFMRIGSFIFCTVLIYALLLLFAIGSSGNSLAYLALIIGIISIVFLEFIIPSKKHYKSGIDDALLYCGLGFTISSLASLMNLNPESVSFYCLFLPLLIIAAIRYLDGLITIIAYCFALIIVILMTMKLPKIAPLILPFMTMLFAIITYLITLKIQNKIALRFWKNNVDIIEGLSLITFYASGNYFIIQKANEMYFNNPIVLMPYLFWAFTFIVPFLYIYQGLKQKNRLILSIGLLAIATGVATFRNYFHVMPLEIAAIIGGAVLLATAYFAIKYLKNNETRFTYAEDEDQKPFYQQAESLIIAQSFGNQQGQNEGKPLFGGGDFGGGGAGQEF